MTTPFIPLAQAKLGVPIRDSNTAFDAKLNSLIMTASEDIEQHTDRKFTYGHWVQYWDTTPNVTRSYDFHGSYNASGVAHTVRRQRFALQGFPIDPTMAFTLYYDPLRLFTQDTIIDPSLYLVDAEQGLLFCEFPTGRTLAGLMVDFWGGYPTDPMTNALSGISARMSLACQTQVAFLWNKLHPDNVGMDADRTKGAANKANMVQKFVAMSGLCPEAAQFVAYLKPLALGRY